MTAKAAVANILGGNDEHAEPTMWLDTGYAPLNKAISGDYDRGLPSGRLVEIFGPESSGKTAIATQVMAHAQAVDGVAAFMDHERSFVEKHANDIGLNTKENWVYKQPRTCEESLDNAIKLVSTIREKGYIDDKAPIVVTFDSIASMLPKSKAGKELSELTMHDNTALARALSAAFPSLADFAEENEALFIFLNQVRTKVGVMFGDPTTTPGGDAKNFYFTNRIKLSRTKIMQGTGSSKELIGQKIKCDVIKNKVSMPFKTADWSFMFREDGSGHFDRIRSMIDYLTDNKILTKAKSSPMIEWIDGKQYKLTTLIKMLEADVTGYQKLYDLL